MSVSPQADLCDNCHRIDIFRCANAVIAATRGAFDAGRRTRRLVCGRGNPTANYLHRTEDQATPLMDAYELAEEEEKGRQAA